MHSPCDGSASLLSFRWPRGCHFDELSKRQNVQKRLAVGGASAAAATLDKAWNHGLLSQSCDRSPTARQDCWSTRDAMCLNKHLCWRAAPAHIQRVHDPLMHTHNAIKDMRIQYTAAVSVSPPRHILGQQGSVRHHGYSSDNVMRPDSESLEMRTKCFLIRNMIVRQGQLTESA